MLVDVSAAHRLGVTRRRFLGSLVAAVPAMVCPGYFGLGWLQGMPRAVLKIQQPDWESLRKHGEETYPHECCGALLGHIQEDSREVREIIRTANMKGDSQDRYSIAPTDLIRIVRESREKGFDIVGFYHSHPDQPAQPSHTDVAEAYWFNRAYVITSVKKGKADVTNAFSLLGNEEKKYFAQEKIQVVRQIS